MRIAVTGGTGFIGRHLVERHVRSGDAVTVLTRRDRTAAGLPAEVRLVAGDLERPNCLPREFLDGVDVLYHCAGGPADRERMLALHVGGTERLIEAAAGRIGRWVQLSSVGVYGRPGSGTIDEDTIPQPADDYERTKWESDRRVIEAGLGEAFEYSIVRPSIVFGTDMRNRSLFAWIEAIRRGWFFFVGPKGASANYIHVDNVVEALVRAATHARASGRTYNVSDWRTIEAFVEYVCGLVGREPPRWRIPAAPLRTFARIAGLCPGSPLTESRVSALCNRARYPDDRIRSELDYDHRVTMEQGLEQVVEHLVRRKSA
jgi:nucleoside-diphosphate-sugar epimerase